MKIEKIPLPPLPLPPPPPCQYVITLSSLEADDLLRVLGCIGGDVPERATTNKIWYALRDLMGLTYPENQSGFRSMFLEKHKP